MRRGSRDNVLAGTLVLASIAAAVVVVVVLAGGFDTLTRKGYTVRFPFSTGVAGLERGSSVELAGVRVGSVGSIELQPMVPGEPERYVHVHFRIDRQHQLHRDARIELIQELLGGSSRLNISSLGSTGTADERTPALGVAGGGLLSKVTGGGGKPMLDSLVGDQRAASIDTFIERWTEVGGQFAGAGQRFNTMYDANADAWADSVSRVLVYLRDTLPLKVDDVVEQFKVGGGFIAELRELFTEQREAIAQGIEAYRSFGVRLDGFAQRNEENLDSIVADAQASLEGAREIVARFDGSDDDPLVRIGSRTERLLEEYTRLGEQGNQIAAENRADMRRAIARLRLTADQALDTMLEVRRSPWRLLYRPDERETAYELLYDSARQYARAVSDLDSISASTAALVGAARDGHAQLDPATMQRVSAEIDEARRSFEQAQDRFLDVLLTIDADE